MRVVVRRWLRQGNPNNRDPGVLQDGVVVKLNGSKVVVRLNDGTLLWVRRTKIVDIAHG